MPTDLACHASPLNATIGTVAARRGIVAGRARTGVRGKASTTVQGPVNDLSSARFVSYNDFWTASTPASLVTER